MRILVIQTYGLGNAILTTPLLQALGSLGEGERHEVHVVADKRRKAAVRVLETCPGVKSVFDKSQVKAIKKKRFETAIDCCDDPRLPGLYAIPRMHLAFLARKPSEKHTDWYARWVAHEADVIFSAANAFGYRGEMPGFHLPIRKDVTLQYGGPKLALGIGYAKHEGRAKKKHWGDEKFAALARRFQLIGGLSFLLGDIADQSAHGSRLTGFSRGAAVSLCGKLSLENTLGVLSQCSLYVGNDTGLTHAAAALGLPTLGIFRPWASSFVKNRPYGETGSYACEWSGTDVSEAVWRWVVDTLPRKTGRRKKKKKRGAKT